MTLSLWFVATLIAAIALWSRLREVREQLRVKHNDMELMRAQRDSYARAYEMLLWQLQAAPPPEQQQEHAKRVDQ